MNAAGGGGLRDAVFSVNSSIDDSFFFQGKVRFGRGLQVVVFSATMFVEDEGGGGLISEL